MNLQKPNNKNKNKWLALINVPIQMGAIIFLFVYLGGILDEKYPNPNSIFIKSFTMLGVSIAFYNILRQIKDIDKLS